MPVNTIGTPESSAPIAESERVFSLDVLRGVAVLGIFVMNSRNFALPLRQFDNPAFPEGSARPIDLWVWAVENTVFEDKMIAIFSMLFGAGIVVAAERAVRPAWTHYKRMFWLLLIGLVHAFGLWYGDILNTYALCGAVLYPVRRARAGLLIGLGVVVLVVAVWARVGPPMTESLRPEARDAPGAIAAGEPVAAGIATHSASTRAAPVESRSDRIWREAREGEAAAYRGSWRELFVWRTRLNEFWHWHGGYSFNFWRCGGFILIGMGLMKLGVFSASRPASVYWGMVLAGYAVGLSLFAVGFWPMLGRALGQAAQVSPGARQMLGSAAWTMRYLGAIGIALGHIGVAMLLCRGAMRVGVLRLALHPLASVGRTALTNYIVQTIVAVIVFDGWAMGNWGTWRMSEIAVLVVCVWAAQLVISPLWLKFMRFGPLEWAWRSLTYWRAQPMVRARAHNGALS